MTRRNKIYNTTGRITTSVGLLVVIALLMLSIIASVEIMMLASIINSMMIVIITYATMFIVIMACLFFIYRIVNTIHDTLAGINKTL